MESPDQNAAPRPLLNDPAIDLHGAARAAFGSALLAGLVGGGFYLLGQMRDRIAARIAEEAARRAQEQAATAEEPIDADELEAAALLGVVVDASADEIRAALRAKLGASNIHPDRGGDGVEARALIDAKNLLIHRLTEETQP